MKYLCIFEYNEICYFIQNVEVINFGNMSTMNSFAEWMYMYICELHIVL